MVVSWWKRKKCPLCKTVLKKKNGIAELRLDTADGPIEMEICMGCSTVLDKSAELLNGPRKENKKETEEDSI